MKKYVTTRSVGGSRDNAGTGFISVPKNQDIDKFIEFCFRTGTISLLLENGGVIDNVLISKTALGEVEFPTTYNSLGSQVVWVNQPRKNQPIIIGSISKTNEFVNFNKNKSSLRRATRGFISEVIVDAERGCVILNSNSSTESGGDIYIISTNKEKSSKLNIIVSNEINIRSKNFSVENSKRFSIVIKDKGLDDEITELTYTKGEGLSYKDEFGNELHCNSENMQIKPKTKLNVGEGGESMVLGDTFKSILDELSDVISDIAIAASTITVIATSFGVATSPPANAASFVQAKVKIEALKAKYKTFKSSKSFLD